MSVVSTCAVSSVTPVAEQLADPGLGAPLDRAAGAGPAAAA